VKLRADEKKYFAGTVSYEDDDFKFLPYRANSRVRVSPARCCSSLDGR
jgi:hypothetical protein